MIGRYLQHVASIPTELQALTQWCVSMPDKAPIYADGTGLHFAKSNNAETWMTFNAAVHLADWLNVQANAMSVHQQLRPLGWEGEVGEFAIGMMFSANDPYAVIDIDVKDAENAPTKQDLWTTEERKATFWRIVQGFNSYTETSPSGKGLHILVRGVRGQGIKLKDLEVYDRERFMRCTGNVVLNLPIEDRAELLEQMSQDLIASRTASQRAALEEVEETIEDRDLFDMACEAENGTKFEELCRGDWQGMGYPSQSEADLALMSIFTFYSRSNEQCRRLFRMTALGKREKACKNDVYLNKTLGLIRGRQANTANIEEYVKRIAEETAAAQRKALTEGLTNPVAVRVDGQDVITSLDDLPEPEKISWPPGRAGDIARFIYQSSMRPVPEVAIVSALGLLAGICGKAFMIPQSGLNMYIILVARSGVGKEAMHSGISHIVNSVRTTVPSIMNFVTFADFVSGPALSKYVAENSSVLHINGEWGRKLKGIAANDMVGPLMSLRTIMTNLYQKSGPASIVGGMSYSNKDNNTQSVEGVAYSMIGETTPGTFYDSLTDSMMEDGFMSRFLVVEYNGKRPELNRAAIITPDKKLLDDIAALTSHALTLNSRHTNQSVSASPEAGEMLNKFDRECDSAINENENESKRQMWNRAHLKACRLAALLAVADNWLNPVVEVSHAEWAIRLIRMDIAMFDSKFSGGDIGRGDSTQIRKMMAVMRDYAVKKVPDSYKQHPEMQSRGVVTRAYLQVRLQHATAFSTHPQGMSMALTNCLRTMEDNGFIVEIPKAKLVEEFGVTGRAYRIVNLPHG